MKLTLFSSIAGRVVPNLVSLQHPALEVLPTILVCPIKLAEPVTNVRTTLVWRQATYTVLCDLVRPVNRRGLHFIGEVDDETSRQIVDAFLRLLPL